VDCFSYSRRLVFSLSPLKSIYTADRKHFFAVRARLQSNHWYDYHEPVQWRPYGDLMETIWRLDYLSYYGLVLGNACITHAVEANWSCPET